MHTFGRAYFRHLIWTRRERDNASVLPGTPWLTRISKADRLRMQCVIHHGLRLHRRWQIKLVSLCVEIQGVILSKEEQVQHILLCLYEICFRGNLISQMPVLGGAGSSGLH